MLIEMLHAKLHRATVTDSCLDYQGSIGVDSDLIAQAGMRNNQRIQVLNINNGERFETYVIPGEPGSGTICLNGAAARKGQVGDLIIIISYCHLTNEEIPNHKPTVVLVDEDNNIKSVTNPGIM